jgi:hypothetical protein
VDDVTLSIELGLLENLVERVERIFNLEAVARPRRQDLEGLVVRLESALGLKHTEAVNKPEGSHPAPVNATAAAAAKPAAPSVSVEAVLSEVEPAFVTSAKPLDQAHQGGQQSANPPSTISHSFHSAEKLSAKSPTGKAVSVNPLVEKVTTAIQKLESNSPDLAEVNLSQFMVSLSDVYENHH